MEVYYGSDGKIDLLSKVDYGPRLRLEHPCWHPGSAQGMVGAVDSVVTDSEAMARCTCSWQDCYLK
eukprot:3573205-Amphidinium_carterae.1